MQSKIYLQNLNVPIKIPQWRPKIAQDPDEIITAEPQIAKTHNK